MPRRRKPEFEPWKRPEMPFERKADPGYRGAGMAAAGLEFAAVVGIFFLGGHWLDGRVDWKQPWFTIVLSMLGVAIAIALLIRQVRRAADPRRDDPDEKE